MSKLFLVTLRAKPGRGADLRRWFAESMPEVRAWDGCESLDVYVDRDNPDTVVLIQRWRTLEDHEACQRWRKEQGRTAILNEICEGPRPATFLEPA